MVPAELSIPQTLFLFYFLLMLLSASGQHFSSPVINFIHTAGKEIKERETVSQSIISVSMCLLILTN